MLDQQIIEAEKTWAQLVVTNAKSILIRNGKVASGRLKDSIAYTVNAQGKINFTYAPEGKWVTLGRRKGSRQPPTAPIERWIKQKGIRGRDPKTGRFIPDKSLAYLIARGIKRDGIAPLPFMSMAIKAAKQQLAKQLKQAATKSTVSRLRKAAKSALSKP